MSYSIPISSPLFAGISEEDIRKILSCQKAECRSFSRGEIIYPQGEPITSMGVLLSGTVFIENTSILGVKSLLSQVEPGQIFGGPYSLLEGAPLLISVTAATDCEVLFLNGKRLLNTCPNTCPFHVQILKNLLLLASRKNLILSGRVLHTTPKSIRGKVLAYLSSVAAECGQKEFDIPFNRQQLADYLGVDRSALSGELSRMQQDGLITVRRNRFQLIRLE